MNRFIYACLFVTLGSVGCGMASLAETIKEDRSFERVHTCHEHVERYTDAEGHEHIDKASECRDTKEAK